MPDYSISSFPLLSSAPMLAVWKHIGRAAASTSPVLITGESGTGKELVARAIHDYSPRNMHPFVAVNLAALSPTVIENELFGSEAGAFIGPGARRGGLFEAAGEGTLFLDEIGDLDSTVQTKLLRVVQDGTYEMLGNKTAIPTRARLIAATNRPVRPGIAGAAICEDLYYHLAVTEIDLPPLRARRSDIPVLVTHALRGTPARAVSEEAMRLLMMHSWSGNVRELCQVVARAAVLGGGEVIDVGNLPEGLRLARTASAVASASAGTTNRPSGAEDLSLHGAVARLEKELILRALDRAQGNRSAAARFLGVSRTLLYAKLLEYDVNGRSGEPIDAKDETEKERSDHP